MYRRTQFRAERHLAVTDHLLAWLQGSLNQSIVTDFQTDVGIGRESADWPVVEALVESSVPPIPVSLIPGFDALNATVGTRGGEKTMIELKRILAPTDFSEYSAAAMSYACALADRFDSELHILHVLDFHLSSTPAFGVGLAPNPRVKESREAAEASLERVATGSRAAVRAIAEGPIFFEILRYAQDNEIDLIVMGTHGRSGLAHVMLGSVAERVVRKAPCPVMTVRHPKHEFVMPFEELPTRRLLDSPDTEGLGLEGSGAD